MAFITDDELAVRFADLIRQTAGTQNVPVEIIGLSDLKSPNHRRFVTDGRVRAVNQITRHWVGLGYTAAQAANWDEALSFSRDLGLFYSLNDNRFLIAGPQESDPLENLDRTGELDGLLTMLIGGVEVQPGANEPGEAVAGILKARQDFDAAVAGDRRGGENFWDRVRRGGL